MTNLELLEYSVNHPNPLIGPYYNKGELVITPCKDQRNSLMAANARLIELITVFNYLSNEGKTADDAEVSKVVDQVIEILDNVDGINFSAFSQFFMVYNSAHSSYVAFPRSKKRMFVFRMLQLYCRERHAMYQSHGYSDAILQVVSDNYSHKRNSKASIAKITDLLEKLGIRRSSQTSGFVSQGSFYLLPDKGDKASFIQFKKEFSVVMESAVAEQGKLPDMVLGVNEEYFIIEAKMMKGSGGGQDKQLVEIINFIRFTEADPKIHYLTYLDGEYADMLFAKRRMPKIQRQYDDLVSCLTNNPGNYFVIPAGFEQLIIERLGH